MNDDPREMRKHLLRASYRGDRVDGKATGPWANTASTASSLVHKIMRAGESHGWSGEDTMTALAYHALVQLERVTDMVLENAYLNPSPPMIFVPQSPPAPSRTEPDECGRNEPPA